MNGVKRGVALAGAFVVLCLAGCSGPTYRARLDDAAGLAEGASVQISGVEVGKVKGVRLVEGEVEVAFGVERGNELQLHPDACAVVVPDPSTGPHLEVMLGNLPGQLGEAPIPRCPLPTEELGALGEALGEGLRELFEGFGQGIQQGSQGMAQGMGQAMAQAAQQMGQAMQQGMPQAGNLPPFQPGSAASPPCAGLTVTVDGVEDVPPGVELMDGGKKMTLVFVNANDHALRLPAIGNVLFLDGQRTALTSQNIPGQTWFMPIDLPAQGRARVVVAFGNDAAALDGIEVHQVTRQDQPLATCSLSTNAL